MTPPGGGLEQAIPTGALVALDASAVLAYLVGTEAVSPAATWIFDGFFATGRNAGVLSTLTCGELLIRPFRTGQAAVATIEGFLRFFTSIRLAEVTYDVAREAARIRAATQLAMPDAIVVATAVVQRADVLVTNDRAWPANLKRVAADLRVLQLGDVAG
ncbi:MAG: type II toxin-antitoxin system VapC family toxin [Candidatus Limnocylindrales bacterium]